MKKRIDGARNHMKVNFNQFCSPQNVERSLIDPVGGEEDGTVLMDHIPTGSGVNRKQIV